jgi:hypothetical protein
MNLKPLIYAAATVLPATGAWALPPATVNGLSAANIIYVSGSTATDKAIQAWAKLNPAIDSNAPFTAGSYDLYKTATGYVLTGTAGTIFGALSGTNIAIIKQTMGGSATGIHNVNAGTAPGGFPDLSNLGTFTGTCGAAANTAASSPFMAFNTYTCTLAESGTIIPNAGISDEDPTTFIGTGGVTAADASALTSQHAVEVPFGVVVSKALRDRLQTAEGLTAGSDLLAQVPSLSTAQLRAIFSGQMISLADLWVPNASNTLTQVDTSGSVVHICRRGDTSGSQFATNIYFFGSGCSKGNGVGGVTTPDNGASQASGEAWAGTSANINAFVFAGSGTGDVLSCVSNTTLATGDTVAYRIGFASMDQAPTVAGTWRYIAINGVAPTIWNIQLNAYDWLTEDTFNYTTASMNRNGGPGNHTAIFTTVATNLSNVNALAGLNAATQNAAALTDASGGGADTGIVTLGNAAIPFPPGPSAGSGWPANIRTIPATAGKGPNSPQSKTYPGAGTNNCNGAYQSNPTG